MGLIEGMKNMLRKWLDIQSANPRVITINELMNFEQNAAKNKIWYRGDSFELSQLYNQLDNNAVGLNFWGAKSSTGLEIRKIHTGVPAIIVDRLTDIVLSDMNEVDIEDKVMFDLWNEISEDTHFDKQLTKAVKEALVIGDGAFKLTFDKSISEYPMIEWVPGDLVEIIYQRGRLKELQFKTFFTEKRKQYVLVEKYGYGYIKNELYRDDRLIPLNITDFTANISDFVFDSKLMMGVPFAIFESSKYENRGQSIFDKKTDAFDSLDEVWSQWIDALRAGRTKQYIPESFLPRDPYTGEVAKPNPFDNRFIKVGTDMREGASNKVEIQQPVIPHDSYAQTYSMALDLALQGLVSPSTLGVDIKKLDNAESQREKEKATLYTRNAIIKALENTLPVLIQMALSAYYVDHKQALSDVNAKVTFGEYANPSFESQIDTIGKGKTQGILSIESVVDELYGDTKDEEWKEKEVSRLKAEQGIAEFEQPTLNTKLGNFEIGGVVDEQINNSNNHEPSVSDESQTS